MTRMEGPARPERGEEAGWFDGAAYLRPVRIYYEDTDFSGLVYHANYLRYFERGRSDFFRAAGVSHAELADRDDPLMFAVRRMEIDYLSPARIDDLLLIRTRYTEIRGARIFADQQAERGDTVIARAKLEAVCIDGAGRPRRMPKDLVEALQPYVEGA